MVVSLWHTQPALHSSRTQICERLNPLTRHTWRSTNFPHDILVITRGENISQDYCKYSDPFLSVTWQVKDNEFYLLNYYELLIINRIVIELLEKLVYNYALLSHT